MQSITKRANETCIYLVAILLFILGSHRTNAQIGVNTGTPLSTFEVNGSVGQTITTLTASTALDATQSTVICNNASTAITITLPNVSKCSGRIYTIKRNTNSTAIVTVEGTIDGATNLNLQNPGDFIIVTSNGNEWKTTTNSNSPSSWSINGNTGTNAGTHYIGTADASNLVLKTNAVSRANITSAGITTIGDATNNIMFEADGSLSLQGTATVFNAVIVNMYNAKLGTSNNPVWAKMKDNGSGSRGVYAYIFEKTATNGEEEAFFTVQIPHNWKEGSAIYPRVIWSPQNTEQTGTAVWGLEYTWLNHNAINPAAFPNTILLNATTVSMNGTTDANKYYQTDLGTLTLDSTQNKINSILMCRFFRKSGASEDTYNGNIAVLSIAFHYETDGMGSRTINAK